MTEIINGIVLCLFLGLCLFHIIELSMAIKCKHYINNDKQHNINHIILLILFIYLGIIIYGETYTYFSVMFYNYILIIVFFIIEHFKDEFDNM